MKKQQKNKEKQKTHKFKKLFKRIVKFFDDILITPISKGVYFLKEKMSFKNGGLEKFLNKPNVLLYVSLICAFACFLAIDGRLLNLVETEAVVLSNQAINVIYNEEAYVVEGIPESADIVLMGRNSDLYLAEQLGDHKLTLDLSGLGSGTHKVSLKYNNPVNTLTYKLDPSTITVVISDKVSEVRTLTTDIINTDKLDQKLVVNEVKLDRDEVIIKSNQEKLKTVASVKALVDVSTLNATQAGTYTLEKVKLIAYDEKGTEIPDIEIVPGTVTATVVITSPSKEVPIKVVPVGKLPGGNAIGSIETSVSKVTIYADESILANVNYIEVEIDVANLNEDKTYQKTITKPNGARSISETNVTIKVKLERETSKDITDVRIEFENLGSGLKALAMSEADTKVTVTVKGVASVLNKINSEDIKAYVDLTGLTPGTHSVPVKVSGSDTKLTYISKTETVNILIQ